MIKLEKPIDESIIASITYEDVFDALIKQYLTPEQYILSKTNPRYMYSRSEKLQYIPLLRVWLRQEGRYKGSSEGFPLVDNEQITWFGSYGHHHGVKGRIFWTTDRYSLNWSQSGWNGVEVLQGGGDHYTPKLFGNPRVGYPLLKSVRSNHLQIETDRGFVLFFMLDDSGKYLSEFLVGKEINGEWACLPHNDRRWKDLVSEY